jgi:hypothetical protein
MEEQDFEFIENAAQREELLTLVAIYAEELTILKKDPVNFAFKVLLFKKIYSFKKQQLNSIMIFIQKCRSVSTWTILPHIMYM